MGFSFFLFSFNLPFPFSFMFSFLRREWPDWQILFVLSREGGIKESNPRFLDPNLLYLFLFIFPLKSTPAKENQISSLIEFVGDVPT